MAESSGLSGLERWNHRLVAAVFLGGQVVVHLLAGKINRRNTLEQLAIVGPGSFWITLIVATSIGAVFTIEVAREFINFGAGSTVGGVLALALARELAPLMAAVVLAGRVGSSFAAEIGTMRVTEQLDALYMLKTDPIDYLVIPRVIACCVMLPILTIFSLAVGLAGGLVMAGQYGITQAVFLNSIRSFLTPWDLTSAVLKALCFGSLISVIGCNWGITTTGGAKGVGQSTTTAVVTSLLAIFISNFLMSWLLFHGTGTATLKGS